MEEYAAMINVRRKNNFLIDSAEDLYGGDQVVVFVWEGGWDCLHLDTVRLFDSSLTSLSLPLFSDSV